MWTRGRGCRRRSNPTQQIMNKEQGEVHKRKTQQLMTADKNREERKRGNKRSL